jgi:hypothetical protein
LTATDLDDAARWKLLHEACADIVALRRGDQNAEFLEIERGRLTVATHEAELKYKQLDLQRSEVFERYKKRIVIGMETLMKHVNQNHPKAKAATNALLEQVRADQEYGPLGDVEGEEKP